MSEPIAPSASSQLAEHLFKRKYGELLGALLRDFG